MLSFLQSRFQLPRCRVVIGLALVAFSMSHEPAQSQETNAIEPVAPTTRVVAYGSGSPFDLTDLGPDFSASWLTAALPVLSSADTAPVLVERIAMNRPADTETRTTYDRASDGRLLARRIEQRRGASWRPVRRIIYDYQNGALTAQRTEAWTNEAWTPEQRITLQRDDDGTVRTVVQQTRRDAQWTNEARLTLQVAEVRPVGSVENPKEVQRQLIRATWLDGTWEQTTRITFTVAEEGRLITQRNETWTGAQWVNSVQLTYMYDGAGYPIERALAVWVGDGWSDGPIHLYDYTVRGERVEQRTETWVGTRHLRTSHATLTYAEPVRTPLLGSASFD